MPAGIIGRFAGIAAHDCHQSGVRNLAEGRPAFYFGHIATSNNSPPDCFVLHRRLKLRIGTIEKSDIGILGYLDIGLGCDHAISQLHFQIHE
jgi:hypothetical protein